MFQYPAKVPKQCPALPQEPPESPQTGILPLFQGYWLKGQREEGGRNVGESLRGGGRGAGGEQRKEGTGSCRRVTVTRSWALLGMLPRSCFLIFPCQGQTEGTGMDPCPPGRILPCPSSPRIPHRFPAPTCDPALSPCSQLAPHGSPAPLGSIPGHSLHPAGAEGEQGSIPSA